MPSYRPPRQDAERLRLERERVAAERGRAASGKCESNGRACAEENVRRGRTTWAPMPWSPRQVLRRRALGRGGRRPLALDGGRALPRLPPRYIQMLRDRGSVPRIQTIDAGRTGCSSCPTRTRARRRVRARAPPPLSHLASPPSLLRCARPAPQPKAGRLATSTGASIGSSRSWTPTTSARRCSRRQTRGSTLSATGARRSSSAPRSTTTCRRRAPRRNRRVLRLRRATARRRRRRGRRARVSPRLAAMRTCAA